MSDTFQLAEHICLSAKNINLFILGKHLLAVENQYLENIKVGMNVVILTSQNKYSTGIIEDIAVRNPFSEEGIMVRLKNGDIGRVKNLILKEPEQNEKYALEIKKIIEKGENLHTEFKTAVLWSVDFNPVQIKETKSLEVREYGQRASKIVIAKSVAAFLNSDGGNLIVGVKENKQEEKFEIIGINSDMKKTQQEGIDGYKRMLMDEIFRSYFPFKIYNHLDSYISFDFVKIDDKIVCRIKVKKSDFRVFLKLNNKEVFMIRINSENRTLDGEKLVDYCIRRWGAK